MKSSSVLYQPQTYAALYGRLLHARRHTVLRIDKLLPVEVSAQELGMVAGELIPSQEKARGPVIRTNIFTRTLTLSTAHPAPAPLPCCATAAYVPGRP